MNHRKLADRLEPKRYAIWILFSLMGVHGHYIAGVEVEPKLSNMFLERNMVTPYFCLLHRQGNRKATHSDSLLERLHVAPLNGD